MGTQTDEQTDKQDDWSLPDFLFKSVWRVGGRG